MGGVVEMAVCENTRISYDMDVAGLCRWAGKQVLELARNDVLAYKNVLLLQKKLNGKSVNRMLSAVRYATKDLVQSDDYVVVQKETTNPNKLNGKCVDALMAKMLQSNYRNYAIVCVLAYAGLRVSEALALQIGDLDVANHKLIVRKGKGSKQRIVIVNDKLISIVTNYVQNWRSGKYAATSPYLFVSAKGEKLNRAAVNHIMGDINPHALRHWYCSTMLEKGVDIATASQQMGHADINTTLRYTHLNAEDLICKLNNI
jgi:integrase/recombinase XerD